MLSNFFLEYLVDSYGAEILSESKNLFFGVQYGRVYGVVEKR